MIEVNFVENTNDWNDKDEVKILIEYNHNNNYNKGSITMTYGDLRKLLMMLNLSIGNVPKDAPDITNIVDQITKGMGFQP